MKSRALAIAAGALVSCQAGFPPGDTGAGKEDNEPSGDPLGLAQVVDADSLSRDPAELAVQADLALRQFRLEDAAALFEAAASAAPSAQSWTYRRAFADALLGLHQDAAAESVYRELLREGKHPDTSTLHSNLAVACLRQGKTSEARAAIDRALEIHPKNPAALKTLGLIDLKQGRRADGERRLRAAVELNPRIPEAQVALAACEIEEGELAQAVERYRQVLDALPEALPSDYHRRWQTLFYPSRQPVAEELRERIRTLESALGARTGAAPVSGSVTPRQALPDPEEKGDPKNP
jgi:tetratricopeptide (TPR) repeat protein